MSAAVAQKLSPSRMSSIAQAASWFRALGDETRLKIVECVLDSEQCVCDLTELLSSKQSLLSFHLKTLKDAGILNDRRDGRWVYYSLNPDAVVFLEQFLGELKDSRRTPQGVRKCCD